MLIICNGAFKSGSSWLHAILVELINVKKLNLKNVPIEYTNDLNSPTTIIESRLQEFLINENYQNFNYLTKAHFFKESTLNKVYPVEVKFLFIKRDMRDAIVSHYFHIRNRFRFKISFSFYYYLLGRYKAYEIGLFNNRCRKYMGEENLFLFEDLISNFTCTVRLISKSLGVNEISDEEIDQIREETTLDKLREQLKRGDVNYYPSKRDDNWKLFREGKIGGWKEHFTINLLKDIEKVESGRFSVLSKTSYFLIFTLRRLIFKIE